MPLHRPEHFSVLRLPPLRLCASAVNRCPFPAWDQDASAAEIRRKMEPPEPSRAELLSQFAQWVSLPAVRDALVADPLYAPASAPVDPVNPVNPVNPVLQTLSKPLIFAPKSQPAIPAPTPALAPIACAPESPFIPTLSAPAPAPKPAEKTSFSTSSPPTQSNVAPAKLAGTRVKVPPVELDCSRRNTTSTAPP